MPNRRPRARVSCGRASCGLAQYGAGHGDEGEVEAGDTLGVADEQVAAGAEQAALALEDLLLRRALEVDHDVAEEHDVELAERIMAGHEVEAGGTVPCAAARGEAGPPPP